MSYELQTNAGLVGYDKTTAEKYTAGQERFFGAEKVEDGATLAMEAEIAKIRERAERPIETLYDLGAGSNREYLRKWLDASGASAVVGVEPLVHMRALSKKTKNETEPITVDEGDWQKTGLPDASADMVVSRFSLHYLRDIREGYTEPARILKPGGYAVISLSNPDYCREEMNKKMKRQSKENRCRCKYLISRFITITTMPNRTLEKMLLQPVSK